MTKLCLNMIVRNEADRIVRCLKSVAPYVDCYSITDTGSTDDTIPIIVAFFKDLGIPGHVHSAPFENFSQARNAALDNARKDPLEWDYVLLCDADMELVVEDPAFKTQLTGLAHHVIQKGCGMAYHNVRFISRKAKGGYVGVTHEYIDIPAFPGAMKGIYFDDHADGANRPNKARRDIRLLRNDLKKNPNNGRSWFYLAQSYKDSGQYEQAIKAYNKVVEVGSWDEEVWYAKFQAAHCYSALGAKDKFVKGMVDAYAYRPSRAEPLWELSKYYREKGDNYASLMFAEEGLRKPYPGDLLFVQDYIYKTGLREEFSISGFYDPSRREKAFEYANDLSLDPTIAWGNRELAKRNLFFYVQPLCESMPSFVTRRIPFTPADGYTAMNPSVTVLDGKIYVCVRSVNYTMDEAGRYLIKGTNGEANGTNPIRTRNYLVELNNSLASGTAGELFPPEGFPAPAYDLVVGFEDTRLFAWRGELWTISNLREQNPEGWCEQWLAPVKKNNDGRWHYNGPTHIKPANRQHEKNWAPILLNGGKDLRFVYRLGEYINPADTIIQKEKQPYAADTLSGGSQYIPFQGGYLGVIHEAHVSPATGKRYYTHRFVYLSSNLKLTRVSKPFVFHDKVIEFAAGLEWHPDGKRLMISYGREDKEAWIATVDPFEVMEFIVNG